MTTNERARARLLAIVHIAKAQLGLDDAAYRAVLWEQTRRESSAKATVGELEKLVKHFESKGFKKKRKPANPQARKIRALWGALAKAGVAKSNDEIAVRAFVKRMTGVDHIAWLDNRQASLVIEALKQWAARTGVEL